MTDDFTRAGGSVWLDSVLYDDMRPFDPWSTDPLESVASSVDEGPEEQRLFPEDWAGRSALLP